MSYVYVPSETVDKLYEIMDEYIFSSYKAYNFCPHRGKEKNA